MNLRILKKLSKRAAPLLSELGFELEQFRASRGENYMGAVVRDRKHWERGRSTHATIISDEIKCPARDGHGGWIYMKPPSQPLKGTIMVGGISGYYEPEWSEETAWEALCQLVYWHFTEWDGEDLQPTRIIRSPRAVFRGAAEMIAAAPVRRTVRA